MIRILIYLFLLLFLSGHTDDTTVSRLGLIDPDESHEGGTTLNTKIRNIWTKIGDEMNSRWIEVTIADTATETITHGFDVVIGDLLITLYDGQGSSATKITGATTPSTSDFTIVANSTNPRTQIDITNNSGGSEDLSVLIIHGGQSSPMDSAGDMIIGGSSGVFSKLDSGADNTVLNNTGAASPAWILLDDDSFDAAAAISGAKTDGDFGTQLITTDGQLDIDGTGVNDFAGTVRIDGTIRGSGDTAAVLENGAFLTTDGFHETDINNYNETDYSWTFEFVNGGTPTGVTIAGNAIKATRIGTMVILTWDDIQADVGATAPDTLRSQTALDTIYRPSVGTWGCSAVFVQRLTSSWLFDWADMYIGTDGIINVKKITVSTWTANKIGGLKAGFCVFPTE